MNLQLPTNGQKKLLRKESEQDGQLEPGTVILDHVSKKFRKRTITKQSYTTVKTDLLRRLVGRKEKAKTNFTTALNDFSINLQPGSSLGVIGRNGSGKSTLLKLISGIYHPDSGCVRIKGKLSALIELGAGFHPDFTGRENVFLGGIMYGLTREEIESLFERIVAYAELEEFIDDPVRTYSSGMYMRLGFSLAIHTDPDVLLVDEVLAVGDAGFIARCHDTISEFKRRGKTLVFVTHDLSAVSRWCDQAIWLEQGVIREQGEPRLVIDRYLQHVERAEREKLDKNHVAQEAENHAELHTSATEKRWGNRDVEILDVRMINGKGESTWLFHEDEPVTIEVDYSLNKEVKDLAFGIGILRADGLDVHGANTVIDDVQAPTPAAGTVYPVRGTYRYQIKKLLLLENSYYLDLAAHQSDGTPFDYHHRLYKFSVRNRKYYSGVFSPEHDWSFDAQYTVEQKPLKGSGR